MAIPNNIKSEMKKALRLIDASQRIFLTTHEGTDGDDLGSALAMRLGLLKLGKDVTVAIHKGVPDYLKFLAGSEGVTEKLESIDFDLVIIFGCNQITRTGLPVLKKFAGSVVNIDHHPDNKLFGAVNIVEPSTSSVAELMWYFFQTGRWEITKDMATCLLTGIFTDTGGFKHANTTSQTLEVASELLKKGARVEKISQLIVGQNNPASIRIWARALENMRYDAKRQMVYSVLTEKDFQETQSTDADLGGFVNFLITIPHAKFSMLLTQDGEVVRGSLRSEPDRNVDVNKIAVLFGGGGHKLASGFKIKGKLEKVGRGWKIV
ncbi:MAG: bifunctional oligoribonuclease/PAP phosphatase NrnA [Candidatus Doudnabacteria bacterium]|nr:bifunctional oligoribonuclease/PAP phosphatase NrnA [Candidatus Doudnabacteria bacterium]